jgi:hypothetical protein
MASLRYEEILTLKIGLALKSFDDGGAFREEEGNEGLIELLIRD